MRCFNSLYLYIFLIFAQYFKNVHSMKDAVLVDISKLEVPDDIKELLLEFQQKNTRLQLEILEARNDLKKCQPESEIRKDVSSTTEKSKVIVEDQTESPIKIHIPVTKTTQAEIKSLPEKCTDGKERVSGVYELSRFIDGSLPLKVYCDFDTQGGGWTVIQRRIDGSVNFNRNWIEYKNGFGDVSGEHWLGLEHIHRMTRSEPHDLMIILEDFDNQTRWAKYDWFLVSGESEQYTLHALGIYSGNAGDSFNGHLVDKFSTPDVDNDTWNKGHCAKFYKSGWWFSSCLTTNLNGPGIKGKIDNSQCCRGIHWLGFRGKQYSLKSTLMMIRPKSYVVPKK